MRFIKSSKTPKPWWHVREDENVRSPVKRIQRKSHGLQRHWCLGYFRCNSDFTRG